MLDSSVALEWKIQSPISHDQNFGVGLWGRLAMKAM